MLTTKLINREDIAVYKQVSETVFDEVLNGFILQAQVQDIAPLLGENLFNDIMKNPSNYSELLTGGTYTVDGKDYENYGLKTVLVHFTYSRYIMFNSVVDTPFSFVEKLNNETSRPVSTENKKIIWQQNKDDALGYWRSVENYLRRTKNTLYNQNICRRENGYRFSIIK